jgi:UDP-N-acetylglucosamine--N-acetylmuramyl-(pentapeptide) pyrophosphoryl-undecaprenol N-acetylglucosamine transferase
LNLRYLHAVIRERTLLVVGGGTGGHGAVAVAVAACAQRRGVRAIVVGDDPAIVERLAAGHETVCIAAAGVPRPPGLASHLARLRVPANALLACRDARRLVDAVQPDGAIVLGGAAAGIVAVAAARRGVRVVVHEQNAVFGVGNALAQRVACGVGVAFSTACARHNDVVTVPIPVRSAFAAAISPPHQRRIVVVGGSGGSAVLNSAVRTALPHWRRQGISGVWLGATSDDDGAGVLTPLRWTSQFADVLAAADVVITVGGAVTLAEAAAVRRPCIVLPRRDVAADHQHLNARALSALDAVHLATSTSLADDVIAVLNDEARATTLVSALGHWAGRDDNGRRDDPAATLVSMALGGR